MSSCSWNITIIYECELTAALAETRADLAAGRCEQESPEAHLARLDTLK